MSFQSFTIKEKPLSWNTVARKHYRVYQKLFNAWKQYTFYAVKEAGIEKIQSYPVSISVHCRWKQKRVHDIDSILYKPIQDQLVSMGILTDDSLQFVDSVAYTGEIGAKNDEMIVTICSV